MDKNVEKGKFLSYGYSPPEDAFDPIYYFSNPSGSLVDYAIHYTNGGVIRYYYQPCYMNLATGAMLKEWRQPPVWNSVTRTYEKKAEDVPLGKADYVWIALRLPSTSRYGMDYEDDANRQELESYSGDYDYDYYDDYDDDGHPIDDIVKTSADDELAIKWWKYCFSKRYSPWRKAIIAPVEYLKNEKGQIIAAKLMIDDTICSEHFVSLCICSRWPWENLGHLRLWGKMREAGFKRYESCYIASHIRFLRDEKNIGFRTCSGHFAFAPWETNINIKWFKNATPKDTGNKLTQHYYCDVEYIWNDTSKDVVGISDCNLYPLLRSEVSNYTGSFGSAFNKSVEKENWTGTLGTWDVVLSKLREHYDQWKA